MTSIETLKRFISFPTVSSEPIIDFVDELAERGEALGGKVHRLQTSATKENLLIQFGEPSADSICLSGHMDVVPVIGQNWDSDPFKALVKDNKLYGRGSCDMKGFFAIIYSILPQLSLQNLKKGITLAFTHDEELGCIGAGAMQEQLKGFDFPLPKAMLIGEPTSLDICHHHGGHSTVVIHIKGRAAHSSKPHLGLSANEWMFRILEVIKEWRFSLRANICSVSGSAPIVNIAQIKGGEAINIIAERAEIQLGIRPMPEHNIQQLLKSLYERLAPLQKRISKLSGKIWIEEVQHAHPLLTKLPTPLEQAIRQEHSSAKAIGAPFSTDGGTFAQMGFQPIICGPGSIDLAHQPNEFIEISEMLQYEKLLGSLLHKWCF